MGCPFPKLGERLQLCASFVRSGVRLCDIGTDHGYLPIVLAKQQKILYAIASDIRPGPLQNAKENLLRYNVSHLVETRISDGLLEIGEEEADDFVIAGMGGELIMKILSQKSWVKNPKKHWILQPMSKAFELREFLFENGFFTQQEEAVIDDKKVYSVMLISYAPEKIRRHPGDLYIGQIRADSEAGKAYYRKELEDLGKRRRGAMISHKGADEERYAAEISAIRKLENL